jgi:hypothetical protein
MGLRFRRSVRLFPGVRLNFSGSGISTSIGARGAHVTYGHGHVRTTVGLPGTGISYTSISKHQGSRSPSPVGNPRPTSSSAGGLFAIVIVGFIFILIVSGLTRSNRHDGSSAATPIPGPVEVRPQPVADVPRPETHEPYLVATDVLNQRDRPNGAVVGILHRGALVDVFEIEQGWARISSAGNPPRWVSATLLCKGETCAVKNGKGIGTRH